MTKEDEIRRGKEAQLLLTNSLLGEMFDIMEKAYLDSWRSSALNDTEGRERLWMLSTLLKEFRVHLNVVAQSGRLTEAQLQKAKGR